MSIRAPIHGADSMARGAVRPYPGWHGAVDRGAITGIEPISGAKYGRATPTQFRGTATKFGSLCHEIRHEIAFRISGPIFGPLNVFAGVFCRGMMGRRLGCSPESSALGDVAFETRFAGRSPQAATRPSPVLLGMGTRFPRSNGVLKPLCGDTYFHRATLG